MTAADAANRRKVFFAYPSRSAEVRTAVTAAVEKVGLRGLPIDVTPWPALPIAGQFIASTVLDAIASSDTLAADISDLNFNVTYEIGYAIGRGRPIVLVRHAALAQSQPSATEVGVFDTLGYSSYDNSDQLVEILIGSESSLPLLTPVELDTKAPVYLLESKHKTDSAIRTTSRVKKARLFFRSFDPGEQSRLSGHEAVRHVAQSHGVLVSLLPVAQEDALVHNMRAAFIAGLAHGMERALAILQSGDDPVPVDYRDLVDSFTALDQIDGIVADFAARIAERFQAGLPARAVGSDTVLTRLHLGASSAENEMRELSQYYLEADPFHRCVRGEVRLAVGRKGSGKTALFVRVRDEIREDQQNIVLDLKPDGYKLVKFKESVLNLLRLGTVEHTIVAFWEYLLLLELCHKALEKDRERHLRDHTLYEAYRELAKTYSSDRYIDEGDFSERMTKLLEEIAADYHSRYSGIKPANLGEPEITSLLYRHNVHDLRAAVLKYLRHKKSVWLLFDNIDKGWPAHGLKSEDLLIVRTLISASRKLEQQVNSRGVEARSVIFLRNDVYEMLVDETPDRGKDTRALLDWTDADMLRELLRRRMVVGLEDEPDFDALWRSVCVSHLDGEETSQYLIDRSLMRPRFLIDLVSHCRGFAVNLGHAVIEPGDIRKALMTYSTDLVTDIGYEIRDVFPAGEDVLYAFIESPPRLAESALLSRLREGGVDDVDLEAIVELLVWYGFLGLASDDENDAYIYSLGVNYNMKLFQARRKRMASAGGEPVFAIGPAFWPALSISR